ncbi:hypothetical protein TVAG_156590 [Trichomonas vaginalis G3]|uniref:Uncharacterized protein n=1 Tax=Trichomonas vaginalis (strain ATCC PRA-98 / G3) TaxID=412133 RepID=A2FRT1_TRIV3|nr:spectrin binding [Trichomonas vaginalis G3]EAX92380.1 hypothetical protein TVAG_156590 [Trichomonas vaginalis G3]KAI5544555.1 spectrin binding [Trichomonas vaginalis G3]|eukprot:XP_001305310.1 hypothetical protein [Trichomonas vaginalis G3]
MGVWRLSDSFQKKRIKISLFTSPRRTPGNCSSICNNKNVKEIAKLIVVHGADINIKNDYWKTALHYAAEKCNDKETFEVLISHGLKINEKDKDGKTALHLTAEFDRLDTVKLLISYGAI